MFQSNSTAVMYSMSEVIKAIYDKSLFSDNAELGSKHLQM